MTTRSTLPATSPWPETGGGQHCAPERHQLVRGWSRVGDYVYSLAVYNDALYVGGALYCAGGLATDGLARWNGTHWSSSESGIKLWGPTWSIMLIGTVRALAVHETGAFHRGRVHQRRWRGCSQRRPLGWRLISAGVVRFVARLYVHSARRRALSRTSPCSIVPPTCHTTRTQFTSVGVLKCLAVPPLAPE